MCKYCDEYENVAERITVLTQKHLTNADIARTLGLPSTQIVITIKARHHIRRLQTPGGGYMVAQKIEVVGERCRDCGCLVSEACPVPRCVRYAGPVPHEDRTLAGVVGVL